MTGGDITLLDNVTCNQQFFFGNGSMGGMIGGTVYANGKTINCPSQGFACLTVLGGTFDMTNSIMNIYYQFKMSPNLNIITTNSKINVGTLLTFDGGGKSYNNVSSSGGILKIKGNLILTDTLTIAGTSTLSRKLVKSDIDGTQCTIIAENILFSNVNIQDINLQGNCIKDLSAIAGGARDLGNNSNIRFSPSLKKKGRQLGYNIGSPKQSTNGVQIGDQVWTAKNYNESAIGGLIIPEVPEATNVVVYTDTFDSTSGWGLTDSTISGGLLNINTLTGKSVAVHTIVPTLYKNRFYKRTYDITVVSGSITLMVGGYDAPTMVNTTGTIVHYFKTGVNTAGGNLFVYSGPSGFVGTVDNISIELIGWASLDTIPNASDRVAWCNSSNLQSNGDIYGKLYTPQTVIEINNQLIATNSDWRVPSVANYTTLYTYLGGNTIAGGKMKELGLSHWATPNLKADNNSGFNGLPAGYRTELGAFALINGHGFFLTTDVTNRAYLSTNDAYLRVPNGNNSLWGMSLRLIKK
jgi:uncharacterized protein (TIGR02145 family)